MMGPHLKRDALNITGGFLALGMLGVVFFITYALVYVDIKPRNESALLLLVGGLLTQLGSVFNFFFGSSSDNKKQADTISAQAETIKSAQAALAPAAPIVTVAPGDTVTVAGTGDAP